MNDRTCIVTRQSGTINELIRFVAGPDQIMIPDIKGNLPGRGAWVTANRLILEKAIRTGAFSKSLKREVVAQANLIELTEVLLKKTALGSLAMARKAGAIVTGASQVDAAIRAGQVAMVLHAREAADDGKRKISQAIWAAEKQGLDRVPVILLFTGDELSLAFGDKHVIHAAVLKGVASDGFMQRAQRLQLYSGGPLCETDKAVKETE